MDDDHSVRDEQPRGLQAKLKHAFAVEKFDESSLSPDDKEILQSLAQRIHAKQMTAPAILWAESHRYLNFIGSQILVMLQPIFDMTNPFLNAILGRFGINIPLDEYPKLYAALEKRYSVEYFIQQLEALSAEDYNKGSSEDDSVACTDIAAGRANDKNNHNKDEH